MRHTIEAAYEDPMPVQYQNLQNDAYYCGYNMIYHSLTDIEFISSDDMFPTIETIPTEFDDGHVTFDIKVSFPDISTDDSSSYDEVSYYLDKWNSKVGRLTEDILRFEYDPSLEGED